jgi:hypothetical protein
MAASAPGEQNHETVDIKDGGYAEGSRYWRVCCFAGRAQTARELLHVCELLQRGMHVEGTQVFLPPGSDVAQCRGFMLAVQQYSILADHDGKTLLGAWAKADTTTTEREKTGVMAQTPQAV